MNYNDKYGLLRKKLFFLLTMPVKNTARHRATMIRVNPTVLGCALRTLPGEAICSCGDTAISSTEANRFYS